MNKQITRGCRASCMAALVASCAVLVACSHASLYKVASDGESRRQAVRLINKGEDVNEVNPANGWTPLHAAAANGHPKMCETLIEHGANVNAQDAQGMTPLHLAMARGHSKTVGVLMAAGADADITNNAGKTPGQLDKSS